MLSATLDRASPLPSAPARAEVIACHACGLVHRVPPLPHRTVARCTACKTPK